VTRCYKCPEPHFRVVSWTDGTHRPACERHAIEHQLAAERREARLRERQAAEREATERLLRRDW